MGGSLTLESAVGRGSTFTAVIKEVGVAALSGLDTDKDKKSELNAICSGPARVLIVDDIDCNRKLLKAYLEEFKFELVEVSNGLEAIENARKYRPDLVLLDMKMPVMDGFEASAILKNDMRLKKIP
ncbi:MAG: response regulator, partial [Deltaproteobacteria bacterium]|nr:response regulator [Deltaproteobacteria bacterium]